MPTPCWLPVADRGVLHMQTIMNLFLAIPSFLGALLSCASLLVCFIFPRQAHSPILSPQEAPPLLPAL